MKVIVWFSQINDDNDNETETLKTLEPSKEVTFIFTFHQWGRVMDSPGADFLAEFTRVVDVVQKEHRDRNCDI